MKIVLDMLIPLLYTVCMINTTQNQMEGRTMRKATAWIVAPIMAITGYRFGKEYRGGVTAWKRIVWAVCSTVTANYAADRISR